MGYEPVERPGSPGSQAARITMAVMATNKSHIDCCFVELKCLPVDPSSVCSSLSLLDLFGTVGVQDGLGSACALFGAVYVEADIAFSDPLVVQAKVTLW